MDPLSILGIGGGLLSGAVNYFNQQEQQKYERDMQERVFQREDTAVQRRAADLEAAGLSKTLAAGSAAGSMAPIRTTTPQMEKPDFSNALALDLAKTQIVKQKADIARTNADTALALQKKEFLSKMNPQTLETEDLRQDNIKVDSLLKAAGISQKQIDTAIAAEKLKWEKALAGSAVIDERLKGLYAEIKAKVILAEKYGLDVDALKHNILWYKEHLLPTNAGLNSSVNAGMATWAELQKLMEDLIPGYESPRKY